MSLVSTDPALGVRLLRATNSAASGLTTSVASIHDAVVLLGSRRIRDWVALMVISDLTHATHDQLAPALIRARMCHTVADQRGLPSDRAFTIGILSGVADLTAQPATALAQNLPLSPDVSAALTAHEGPLGDVLATVRAYENTEPDAPGDELAPAYLAALAWSTRTLTSVSGSRT